MPSIRIIGQMEKMGVRHLPTTSVAVEEESFTIVGGYGMPAEHVMKAAMQKYIDAFNARDADTLISLFAEDATIEDPVGSKPIQGIEAITKMYTMAVTMVTEMSLSAPIRGSHANAAAMAFDFKMNLDGQEFHTRAIDVMEFNEDGKIKSMRAYWGPGDSKKV